MLTTYTIRVFVRLNEGESCFKYEVDAPLYLASGAASYSEAITKQSSDPNVLGLR
jgi:hypothetical protein